MRKPSLFGYCKVEGGGKNSCGKIPIRHATGKVFIVPLEKNRERCLWKEFSPESKIRLHEDIESKNDNENGLGILKE
jgi:hypothetical protein